MWGSDMPSNAFELIEFRDASIRVLLPQYLKLERGEVGEGDRFEIGYYSKSSQRPAKNQDTLFITLRRPGSPLAKQLADLLLVPIRAPLATLTYGPSELLPDAVQRIFVVPQRDFFEMSFAYSEPRAEVAIRIQGHGKYDSCQPMWAEVVRSLQLLDTFRFESRLETSPLSSSSESPVEEAQHDSVTTSAIFQQWLDALPEELAFLQPAIVAVAKQSLQAAEDADLSELEAILRQRLPSRASQAKAMLKQWFASYDRWLRPRQAAAAEEVLAFAIVHGALFGFVSFGLSE